MEMRDILSLFSNLEEQQMQQIQDKAKESSMVSFQQLHSHLKLLSNNDLKGTRTECGFKRAFVTLFSQDVETFTGTMFLNVHQLEKQLDNEEFQEIGSMASFKVLETQFQMFIKSRIYLDDEYVVMTRNYFRQYTQLEIPKFRDTMIQLMESVKKSNNKRAQHKRKNISKNMPRFSSNDMVHNHYLEKAKNKTQDEGRNAKPNVLRSARSQSTTNGSKPKPRINNQNSRNWHASKISCITTKTVPIAEHSRNSRNFSYSKHSVCLTCQKFVFNGNHDSCVTKFLKDVNSCAKVPSNKTTNKNKPVEQISVAKKPER
nr:hypothetical protein [Tanacetum cinerariifolium]